MAITFTYHEDTPRIGPSLAKQVGNAVSVSDAAASSAVVKAGLYRIAATTASLVNIGPAVTNGANGEYWPAGQVEVRYLAAGDKIGVSAGA